MARKKREWYPGATYHVMSRGNRQKAIFKDVDDYIQFLNYIKLVQEKYPFKLHAYCLMTNHFHLEIETEQDEIWKIMQKILALYSSEFNHKYKYVGHVFQGRYVSSIIEDDTYFLEVSRYIHLNPVKAGMVREALDYKYSSYGKYMDVNLNNKLGDVCDVVTEKTLGLFGKRGKEGYRMFVEGKQSHEEKELLIMNTLVPDPITKMLQMDGNEKLLINEKGN